MEILKNCVSPIINEKSSGVTLISQVVSIKNKRIILITRQKTHNK